MSLDNIACAISQPVMVDQNDISKRGLSVEWLLRGSLTRLGDIFDRYTRRKEVPPSSLATSQLVERLKRLLDSKAKVLPEKGKVVPHNIRLRIQWDKFATDQNDTVERLHEELLAAAVDHINDSQYYTLSPIDLQVSPDYFTDGVKLLVSFDTFEADESDGLNITVPAANLTSKQAVETAEAELVLPVLECFIRSREIRSPLRIRVPSERRITVGRAGGNQLSIDDASISKFHASISIAPDGSLSVADTGSTNGTFINGERIAYGKSVPVNTDDIVKFGAVEVTLKIKPEGHEMVLGSGDTELNGPVSTGVDSEPGPFASPDDSSFQDTISDHTSESTDDPAREIG